MHDTDMNGRASLSCLDTLSACHCNHLRRFTSIRTEAGFITRPYLLGGQVNPLCKQLKKVSDVVSVKLCRKTCVGSRLLMSITQVRKPVTEGLVPRLHGGVMLLAARWR